MNRYYDPDDGRTHRPEHRRSAPQAWEERRQAADYPYVRPPASEGVHDDGRQRTGREPTWTPFPPEAYVRVYDQKAHHEALLDARRRPGPAPAWQPLGSFTPHGDPPRAASPWDVAPPPTRHDGAGVRPNPSSNASDHPSPSDGGPPPHPTYPPPSPVAAPSSHDRGRRTEPASTMWYRRQRPQQAIPRRVPPLAPAPAATVGEHLPFVTVNGDGAPSTGGMPRRLNDLYVPSAERRAPAPAYADAPSGTPPPRFERRPGGGDLPEAAQPAHGASADRPEAYPYGPPRSSARGYPSGPPLPPEGPHGPAHGERDAGDNGWTPLHEEPSHRNVSIPARSTAPGGHQRHAEGARRGVPARVPPGSLPGASGPASHMRTPLYPPPVQHDPRKALFDKIDMVRRGKWYLLAIFLLVMGAAVAAIVLLPPKYEAYSLLLLDTREANDSTPAVSTPAPEDIGFQTRKLSNQALLLGQSLRIAERTAEKLLAMDKLPGSGRPFTLAHNVDGPLTVSSVAQALQKEYISIRAAGKEDEADAIWITATSRDPEEAALLANTYARAYVQQIEETNNRHLVTAREFLEQQLAQRKGELKDVEDQITQYTSRHQAIALDADAQHTINQIATLEAQLDAARIDEDMHRASLTSLQQELTELQPKLVDRIASGVDKDLATTQDQIDQLQQRLDRIYTNHPEYRDSDDVPENVQAIRDKIDEYRGRVQSLSSQFVDELFAAGGIDPRQTDQAGTSYLSDLKQRMADERVAISGAEQQVASLRQRLQEYNQKQRAIPTQQMELAQLQRARSSTEQLYLSLVKQLQDARIAEESESGYAEVIRPATLPEKPASPNKPLILGFGFVLALLLSGGGAFVRHRLDARIYSPSDLQGAGQTVAGVVPDMERTLRKEFGKKQEVRVDWRNVSTRLLSLLRPYSAEAEAYRRLFTNLRLSDHQEGPQTVVVTSAEMGVGKSVTAANLAITAAQAGRRTLLVDADLHRPSLAKYLGFMPGPELTQILLEQRVQVSIEHFASGIPHLYAFALNDHATMPAGLLGSDHMRQLVDNLRRIFDVIIFDAPPALATTDASLLATQCDATVIVTASASSSREDLNLVTDELRTLGAPVAGVVLNRFDPSRAAAYKSSYKYRAQYYQPAGPPARRLLG